MAADRPPSRDATHVPPPLEPYAAGERPWPIVVSALVAVALGTLTLSLWLTDVKVAGTRPSASVVIVYTALMYGCASGVWRMRYGAVLAFQALLAMGILGFALAAIQVTSVTWLLICGAVICAAGWLFWKLVRVLGRLQATARVDS